MISGRRRSAASDGQSTPKGTGSSCGSRRPGGEPAPNTSAAPCAAPLTDKRRTRQRCESVCLFGLRRPRLPDRRFSPFQERAFITCNGRIRRSLMSRIGRWPAVSARGSVAPDRPSARRCHPPIVTQARPERAIRHLRTHCSGGGVITARGVRACEEDRHMPGSPAERPAAVLDLALDVVLVIIAPPCPCCTPGPTSP